MELKTEKLKAVIGITNKTQDNMYIPFLDFDCDKIDFIPQLYCSIKDIQLKYDLGFAFVISSTNGYNVFFLDKMSFNDCLIVCENARFVDENFKKYAKEKNNFTLRLGKDKKFMCIIKSYKYKNPLSFAHYSFFNEFFHVDILNGYESSDLNFDNLQDIEFVKFMSKKYGYLTVD